VALLVHPGVVIGVDDLGSVHLSALLWRERYDVLTDADEGGNSSPMPSAACRPGSMSPEDQLLSRAQAGDRDAFTTVVEPYRGALHAHCYRMLGSFHDAEEATQETLLRGWTAIGTYEARA